MHPVCSHQVTGHGLGKGRVNLLASSTCALCNTCVLYAGLSDYCYPNAGPLDPGGLAGDKEIVGTLRGFDVYVNMVLEDVQEIEVTPEGKRITKLDQILLNGNNIAVLVPGGKPDDVE
jgi:U6 snRNA-associated Sm-like protein LSm5